jgi:hypothetical protein
MEFRPDGAAVMEEIAASNPQPQWKKHEKYKEKNAAANRHSRRRHIHINIQHHRAARD